MGVNDKRGILLHFSTSGIEAFPEDGVPVSKSHSRHAADHEEAPGVSPIKPVSSSLIGERIIYGRKPNSCLGRAFNFKLGSLTDNTINPVNANGHF
jgi:hypothetical protein